MHQANSLKKCLERVPPAYIWWRFNPAMKPHSAAKGQPLGQNRTKLNTKGNPLPRGFEQVNRALSKWTVCWHRLTPPNDPHQR
jgi:hypothetical protein